MGNFFAYFALVTEIIGAVGAIRVQLASKHVTGPAIYADVQPVLTTLQQINAKVSIPPELAQSICEVVAETITKFYNHPPKP